MNNFFQSFKLRLNSIFWFFFRIDPNKSLQSNPIFWLFVGPFLIFGLILLYPFFTWDLPEVNQYNNIFDAIQYPILILSIAIPLGVMIGRFHGSKQLAESNAVARENINFNNYYSHREKFFAFIKDELKLPYKTKSYIKPDRPTQLYKLTFPSNSPKINNISISEEAVKLAFEAKRKRLEGIVTSFHRMHGFSDGQPSRPPNQFELHGFLDDFTGVFGFSPTDEFIDLYTEYETTCDSLFKFLRELIRDGVDAAYSFGDHEIRKLGWNYILFFDSCFEGILDDPATQKIDKYIAKQIRGLGSI